MKRRLVLAAALVTFGFLFFFKLNFVRGDKSAGMLLWNDSEAYLLVQFSDSGIRLNLPSYALEPLREYLYAPAQATDQAGTFTIMRITPTGVDRNVPKDHLPLLNITPLPEGVYAESPQGLCKLIGLDFQVVSKDKEQRMGGVGRLTKGDFSNINGWYRRRFWGSPAREPEQPWVFSANLKDGTKLTVSGGNPVSIDLQRPGQPSETIWYHKQGIRTVRLSEYRRSFQQH